MRGESVGLAMVDLNGHEAGNGGYSQGTYSAPASLLLGEMSGNACAVWRLYGQVERSPANASAFFILCLVS